MTPADCGCCRQLPGVNACMNSSLLKNKMRSVKHLPWQIKKLKCLFSFLCLEISGVFLLLFDSHFNPKLCPPTIIVKNAGIIGFMFRQELENLICAFIFSRLGCCDGLFSSVLTKVLRQLPALSEQRWRKANHNSSLGFVLTSDFVSASH